MRDVEAAPGKTRKKEMGKKEKRKGRKGGGGGKLKRALHVRDIQSEKKRAKIKALERSLLRTEGTGELELKRLKTELFFLFSLFFPSCSFVLKERALHTYA